MSQNRARHTGVSANADTKNADGVAKTPPAWAKRMTDPSASLATRKKSGRVGLLSGPRRVWA